MVEPAVLIDFLFIITFELNGEAERNTGKDGGLQRAKFFFTGTAFSLEL